MQCLARIYYIELARVVQKFIYLWYKLWRCWNCCRSRYVTDFIILFNNNELCEWFISIGWTMEFRMKYCECIYYIWDTCRVDDFSLGRVLCSAAIVEDYSKERVGHGGNKGTEGQNPIFWISCCKKMIPAVLSFKIILTSFFLIKCHLSVEPIWAPSVSSTFLCLLQGFRCAPERLKEKVNDQL